ncbi:MAG: DUF4363 family protein [Oscillospiraceae bacterium]
MPNEAIFLELRSACSSRSFGATLINTAVADGLVTDWCAELDELQDTAQAKDWDSVRDELSVLHESWDAHATYFHIILQHDELNEVESLLARADPFAFEQDEGEFRARGAQVSAFGAVGNAGYLIQNIL